MDSMRLLCALLVAAALTILGGCGSSTTPGTVSNGNSVPAGYPKDVPVYPGARVASTQALPEKHLIELTLESADERAKIGDYYRTGLQSAGWKIDNSFSSTDVTAFIALKS